MEAFDANFPGDRILPSFPPTKIVKVFVSYLGINPPHNLI
jgi:hypothetical protein